VNEGMSSAAEPGSSVASSFVAGAPPKAQLQHHRHAARHHSRLRQVTDNLIAAWEPRHSWLVLFGVIGTATLFVLYGLTRSPQTWADEAFFAEPSRILANSGSFSDPMFFNIGGLNHYFFVQPPAYFLFMAGAYRLLGFSQTVTRLGSAVPYLAGIVVAFFLIRVLAGRVGLDRRLSSVAGLLAAFLIAFNEQSIWMARSARGDSFGVLLVLLGWLCVAKVAHASAYKTVWVSSGFVLLLLAALTHPALGGPAVGLIAAAVCFAARLGISRRTALLGLLTSALLVLLPYGAWSLLHFYEWRAQLLHCVISAGSMRYGSFLSTQLSYLVGVAKYSPVIIAVLLIGLIVFPWRTSPDAAGALIGATTVTLASTDPYIRFLLQISLAPAVVGIVLLSTRVRPNYRRFTTALVLLAALNAFAFPVLRAYEVHKYYHQRDPMLVTENITRFVPRGAHLIGIPDVYFATIAARAEYREWRLLLGLQWGNTTNLRTQFRQYVKQYKPTWFALPLGIEPTREYCYLPVRFHLVSTVNVHFSAAFNTGYPGYVAYALWTVTSPGAAPEC
jgi:4-amino-4-deoxy-L-arabinose transferase-like glycosyltransferase